MAKKVSVKRAQEVLDAVVAGLDSEKTACDIAIILGNEGVRGAICGDPYKCALAQYIANETGFVASVGYGLVKLYTTMARAKTGEGAVASTALNATCGSFITKFDGGGYKFLAKLNKNGKPARAHI